MKKILLSIMALLMSASMVFGHNNVGDLMDTLTAPNRLKATFDQVGVLFGTDTLRFSVGMSLDSKLLSNGEDNKLRLGTSPFVSFGYKTPAFGVAVGYQFYNVYKSWTMHAPGLALTFMDNNLRILAPVRIASGRNTYKDVSAFDLGPDGVWVRYNTGVEALPQIRVYAAFGSVKIGKDLPAIAANGYSDGGTVSSFGAQVRAYLKKFMFGDVGVQPQVRLIFDMGLSDLEFKYADGTKEFVGSSYSIKGDRTPYASDPTTDFVAINKNYKKPIHMQVRIPVEITAANDVVDFYLVPDIRFDMVTGKTDAETTKKNATYYLGYNFYSELTFFATENLSFYLETDFGGYLSGTDDKSPDGLARKSGLMFAGNAGLTWNF